MLSSIYEFKVHFVQYDDRDMSLVLSSFSNKQEVSASCSWGRKWEIGRFSHVLTMEIQLTITTDVNSFEMFPLNDRSVKKTNMSVEMYRKNSIDWFLFLLLIHMRMLPSHSGIPSIEVIKSFLPDSMSIQEQFSISLQFYVILFV